MTSGQVVHREFDHSATNWWGERPLQEYESAGSDHQTKLQFYWVNGMLDVQPVQGYLPGAHSELANSTVESHNLKGRPFVGQLLSCSLSDSQHLPVKDGDETIHPWFAHTAKLSALKMLGSYRYGVSIRTSGDTALLVSRNDADDALAFLLTDPETRLESSLDPIVSSFAERLKGEPPSAIGAWSGLTASDPTPYEVGTSSAYGQDETGVQSTITELPRRHFGAKLEGAALFITQSIDDLGLGDSFDELEQCFEATTHPAVQAFASGIAGVRPSISTLESAAKIVEAALRKTDQREIEVDDTDGALAFELRLASGLLVVGELSLRGDLHANVYYDQHPDVGASIEEIWTKHLPDTTAEHLIDLF